MANHYNLHPKILTSKQVGSPHNNNVGVKKQEIFRL